MTQSIQKSVVLALAALMLLPAAYADAKDNDKNKDRRQSPNLKISKVQTTNRNRTTTTPSLKVETTKRKPTFRPMPRPSIPLNKSPSYQVKPQIKPSFNFGNKKPSSPKTPLVKNPNLKNPGIFIPGNKKPTTPKLPQLNPKPGLVKKPNIMKPGVFLPGNKKPVAPKPPVNNVPGVKKFQNLVGNLNLNTPKKIAPIPLNNLNLPKILKMPQNGLGLVGNLQAKKMGIAKLSLKPKCHWWFDAVIGCNWYYNHCHWNHYCYTPGYWDCWTPCHYHVVYCHPYNGYVGSSWYLGMDCILIPEMAAYGVQDVMPNSPAAFAGLKPGDMIISINGMGIVDEFIMEESIRTSHGHLEFGVLRDGAEEPEIVPVDLWRVKNFSF